MSSRKSCPRSLSHFVTPRGSHNTSQYVAGFFRDGRVSRSQESTCAWGGRMRAVRFLAHGSIQCADCLKALRVLDVLGRIALPDPQRDLRTAGP